MPTARDRSTRPLFLDDRPLPEGFHFLPHFLDETAQRAMLADVRNVLEVAPLFQQRMPKTGAPLSVRMTNAGDHGWVTDRERGYRYQATHPETGKPWPPVPPSLLKIWTDVTRETVRPNLCLINYYDGEAKLGLHQDRGNSSLDAPVVSISLGDDATFVVGGLSRKVPTRRLELHSGDLVWFGGPSRLIFHGVTGTKPGTSSLLKEGGLAETGRINLTLRRINEPG